MHPIASVQRNRPTQKVYRKATEKSKKSGGLFGTVRDTFLIVGSNGKKHFALNQNNFYMDTSKLDTYDNRSFQRFSNPSLIEKDLQTLVGIIKGIKSDNIITNI